jgi:hypothetical protein
MHTLQSRWIRHFVISLLYFTPTDCPIAFERINVHPARLDGVPFASNALARLSQLSVRFIKLGIYPELIEPEKSQQNGVHERMHRTLKQEATLTPGSSLRGQQRKFDRFREEFPVPGRCNQVRLHDAIRI